MIISLLCLSLQTLATRVQMGHREREQESAGGWAVETRSCVCFSFFRDRGGCVGLFAGQDTADWPLSSSVDLFFFLGFFFFFSSSSSSGLTVSLAGWPASPDHCKGEESFCSEWRVQPHCSPPLLHKDRISNSSSSESKNLSSRSESEKSAGKGGTPIN